MVIIFSCLDVDNDENYPVWVKQDEKGNNFILSSEKTVASARIARTSQSSEGGIC